MTNKTDYLSREDYHKFIKVQVLGTETRQSFFSSYTVYIVQVEQNGKVSIFYPRFKNLLKIQDIISKEGAKLNVPRLYK